MSRIGGRSRGATTGTQGGLAEQAGSVSWAHSPVDRWGAEVCADGLNGKTLAPSTRGRAPVSYRQKLRGYGVGPQVQALDPARAVGGPAMLADVALLPMPRTSSRHPTAATRPATNRPDQSPSPGEGGLGCYGPLVSNYIFSLFGILKAKRQANAPWKAGKSRLTLTQQTLTSRPPPGLLRGPNWFEIPCRTELAAPVLTFVWEDTQSLPSVSASLLWSSCGLSRSRTAQGPPLGPASLHTGLEPSFLTPPAGGRTPQG